MNHRRTNGPQKARYRVQLSMKERGGVGTWEGQADVGRSEPDMGGLPGKYWRVEDRRGDEQLEAD